MLPGRPADVVAGVWLLHLHMQGKDSLYVTHTCAVKESISMARQTHGPVQQA